MCVNAEESHGVVNDEVSGSATVRSRRATDLFAGLPIARAALKFASARHASQYREIDHAPFITHPIEVGCYCSAMGSQTKSSPPACFMTCSRRPEPLARSFNAGSEPALPGSSSRSQTIHRSTSYQSRKRELRDRVAHAGSDTVAIFAADKISKVRELALLPTSRLDDTTTRAKLAHYRASLEMLRGVAGNSALVDLLDAELNRLVAQAVTRTRGDGAATGIPRREAEQAASSRNLSPSTCRGQTPEAVTSVGATRSCVERPGARLDQLTWADLSCSSDILRLARASPSKTKQYRSRNTLIHCRATADQTRRRSASWIQHTDPSPIQLMARYPGCRRRRSLGSDSRSRVVMFAIDCPRSILRSAPIHAPIQFIPQPSCVAARASPGQLALSAGLCSRDDARSGRRVWLRHLSRDRQDRRTVAPASWSSRARFVCRVCVPRPARPSAQGNYDVCAGTSAAASCSASRS